MTRIYQFGLETIKRGESIFILGPEESGKTSLIERLTKLEVFKLHQPIIFRSKPDELALCDERFIFTESRKDFLAVFDEELIKTEKRAQELAKHKQRQEILLVVDNMVTKRESGDWVKKGKVKGLILCGRHWGATFILSSEFQILKEPCIIHNLGYIFIISDGRPHEAHISYLHNLYASHLNKQLFTGVFRRLKNHQCLVIDNVNQGIFYL